MLFPRVSFYTDLQAYIARNYVDEEKKQNQTVRETSDGAMLQMRAAASCVQEPFCEKNITNSFEQEDALEEDDEDYFDEEYFEPLEIDESALQERMRHLADTFQQYLLYLMDSRGLSNTEVYKRAMITKQLFSKIKRNPHYHPDKATAMRLCVGAQLSLDETKDLLARAGYALSPCDKRDVIFSYFIEQEFYDMIEIDIALETYGLPCFIE